MAARLSRLFGAITSSTRRILTSKSNLLAETPSAPSAPSAGYKTFVPWIPRRKPDHEPVEPQITLQQEKLINDVMQKINEQIVTQSTSRLFAVVQVCGKQFKVTESDLIIVQGYWPPQPGDKLKLEKVLLLGGTDFTLVGRPILNRELVSVDATVIEKTMSHTKTEFRMIKRRQYRRIKFKRIPHTVLRINSINVNRAIDEKPDVEGLDRIY